jgi:L-cysteate sulfo-lyase
VPDAAGTVRALVASITATVPEPNDVQIHRNQIGDGYATLASAAHQAMHLAAGTEGLFLDPPTQPAVSLG